MFDNLKDADNLSRWVNNSRWPSVFIVFIVYPDWLYVAMYYRLHK